MKGFFKMTIHFTLDFEDLLAFQRNVIKYAHTHQIKKAYFKWISAIILFILSLYLIGLSLITAGTSLLIAIIYIVIFPCIYDKVTFSRLTKKLEQNDYSHVLGECEVTISDEGIERKLSGRVMHFEWDRFEKWHEDDGHYFLYVSDLEGIIISKNPEKMCKEDRDSYNDFFKNKTSNYIKE